MNSASAWLRPPATRTSSPSAYCGLILRTRSWVGVSGSSIAWAPAFPPSLRDAALLGGTVFDLLAREEGAPAVARLATARLPAGGARAALERAFGGRPLRHSAEAWRAHLQRLAGA